MNKLNFPETRVSIFRMTARALCRPEKIQISKLGNAEIRSIGGLIGQCHALFKKTVALTHASSPAQ